MKVYHGTSEASWKKIKGHGALRPRGLRGQSNWKHSIESNPRAVYFTDAYALYFSINATEGSERLAVLEIDTERLDPRNLAADEDVLEQGTRGNDSVPGDMVARTRYYRRHALNIARRGLFGFEKSLQAMGTAAHYGDIPLDAISRVALIEPTKAADLCWAFMDPSITVLNYWVCAPKYRTYSRWIFGDAPLERDATGMIPRAEIEAVDPVSHEGLIQLYLKYSQGRNGAFPELPPQNRQGIEIIKVS